ncbi:MAG: hypothetical protein A2746_01010 [Candidatus Yanofskybacteria bacterium RIFCSPHIGHO2_01_FULL_44_22]|uniref:Uncharacterized protein n=1 Tax=Candidatus Yanofskybacteria bacterium RIFCSPHIGHO2_01_FULL_44_22 TaxID=1802669 RepID=A0A1F8EWI0_9BACT|nr:MAG: hypothetical protein A2746_01010 [Candidatus Yanofskybacteria bacterium RIFCSPHIGHO2_01_FULL_44_22]
MTNIINYAIIIKSWDCELRCSGGIKIVTACPLAVLNNNYINIKLSAAKTIGLSVSKKKTSQKRGFLF